MALTSATHLNPARDQIGPLPVDGERVRGNFQTARHQVLDDCRTLPPVGRALRHDRARVVRVETLLHEKADDLDIRGQHRQAERRESRGVFRAQVRAPRQEQLQQLDRAGIIRSDQQWRTACVGGPRIDVRTGGDEPPDLFDIGDRPHQRCRTAGIRLVRIGATFQQLVHGRRVARLNSQHQDGHGGFAFDRRKG